MRTLRYLAALVVVTGMTLPCRATVYVKHAAPKIEHKTFDPAHPPAEMPHLEPGEAAVTVSDFHLQAGTNYELVDRHSGPDGWTSTILVKSVTVSVQVTVTIWLPPNVSEKLKAHEEGHRKITEQIYLKRSMDAAKLAGGLIDGKQLTGQGPDWKKAAQNAVLPSMQEAGNKYLELTSAMSAEVNNDYDAITRHGTNSKLEDEAIREAFAQYDKDHSTTQPADAGKTQ